MTATDTISQLLEAFKKVLRVEDTSKTLELASTKASVKTWLDECQTLTDEVHTFLCHMQTTEPKVVTETLKSYLDSFIRLDCNSTRFFWGDGFSPQKEVLTWISRQLACLRIVSLCAGLCVGFTFLGKEFTLDTFQKEFFDEWVPLLTYKDPQQWWKHKETQYHMGEFQYEAKSLYFDVVVRMTVLPPSGIHSDVSYAEIPLDVIHRVCQYLTTFPKVLDPPIAPEKSQCLIM